MVESAGVNMNTWVVGNAPVGHYTYDFPKVIENQERKTKEKTALASPTRKRQKRVYTDRYAAFVKSSVRDPSTDTLY